MRAEGAASTPGLHCKGGREVSGWELGINYTHTTLYIPDHQRSPQQQHPSPRGETETWT